MVWCVLTGPGRGELVHLGVHVLQSAAELRGLGLLLLGLRHLRLQPRVLLLQRGLLGGRLASTGARVLDRDTSAS